MEEKIHQPQSTHENAPPSPTQGSAQNDTLMGILCYLSFLVFIPFVAIKDNAFIKFHARQGLGVFSLGVVSWILGFMPGAYIFSFVVSVLALVLSVMGIINVVTKKMNTLPIANQISDLLNL